MKKVNESTTSIDTCRARAGICQNAPPNTCQKCNKIFTSKGVLNRHLLKIHGIDNRAKIIKNTQNHDSTDAKTCQNSGIRGGNFSENFSNSLQKTPVFLQKTPKKCDTQKSKSVACDYCQKRFTRVDNLSRHIASRCRARKENLKKLDLIRKENEKIRRENDEIKQENMELKQINKDVIKTNKYAMSTFNTLVTKFINSPPLEKICTPEIETLMYKGVKDNKLIECLIYYHRNKALVKYIGGAIISSYKKEDPHTQSFWNSDTQRLTYIIKTITNENAHWIRNNGGTQVVEYIIQPILDYLDNKIRDYIKSTPRSRFLNVIDYNDHMMDAHNLSVEVTDKKELSDKILTYISPYFHFRTAHQLEYNEEYDV